MATIPTQNPVPSEAAIDLKFNAGKIDEFVTSFLLKYTDRLGRDHLTIEGIRDIVEKAIKEFGWVTIDSFEIGATLANSSEVLRWQINGEYYRWDGSFPKVVPNGSTPATTGGIGAGKWLSVGDAALRSALAAKDGYSYLGELQSVADFAGLVKQNGARVKLRSWYAGWEMTTYGKPRGGGEFIYQSGVAKSKHDGCIYFSPTVPYSTTLSNYVTGVGETDSSGSGVWVRDIGDSTHIHTDWAGIGDGSVQTSISAHGDAVQKVFNACSALNKHVFFDDGWVHLEKAVNLGSFSNNIGALPNIAGAGIGNSFVLCYPLGTDIYTITIESTQVTQSWSFNGIYFREKGLAQNAYMVKLKQITGAVIERVKWGGGYQQLLTQNFLSSTFIECSWFAGVRGGRFQKFEPAPQISTANAVRFIRCQILSMVSIGFWVEGCTQFQIIGGSMEGCGAEGDRIFRGVYFQGVTGDGTQGLLVDGLYVEGCSGFPFYITHSGNRSWWHTFKNCNFNNNRTRYPASQIIVLGGNYTYPAGVKMTLELHSNVFTGFAYVGDVSRPDVSITGYPQLNQAVFIDYNNTWIPNQPPVLDSNVYWKTSPDSSFRGVVDGSSASVSDRKNITSATKGGTGTYTINVNHTITGDNIQATAYAGIGFAIVNTAPSGNSLVVRTYNQSGAAADLSFYIEGKRTAADYTVA
ncbi:hypothetical protein H0I54_16620 [Yersinia kristensenii]|uniref:tail fiber/spike domain-containing protein n=1 Tax=Yersinia kristensenii TaxID=28152 RepID=UPI001C60D0D4|nr:hypothetical protein [Yersinia kristensenii]MBW5843433.1 hypothetical protein [Yersinia kristensenii]